MNNNRGYTLVEIISVIAIIAVISGIFVLSFMKKNNKQLDENYNNEISKLEAASDSFVMTYKDSDDENFKIMFDFGRGGCHRFGFNGAKQNYV